MQDVATVGELKTHATRRFANGDAASALRLYDAVVAAAPLDYEARLRIADCLTALGHSDAAAPVYRAVAWYAMKSGHPLVSVVCARVLESLGAEHEDLATALVVQYGSDSELIGSFAARVSLPPATLELEAPELRAPPTADWLAEVAARAVHCCDDFDAFPEVLHPIPLLSSMSEAAFRRVLATLVVRRLPHGEQVVRQGDPGASFYFVATGEVRVCSATAEGQRELARLHENALFGEMALLSAQPRSASVEVLGEADLLEVTRASLAALADELAPVAQALHGFTRERLIKNLMAQSPLFRPFDRTQQRELLRRFTSHDVAAGAAIIGEGEEGRGLFLVLSGEVEVTTRDDQGESVALAKLGAGDVFGEISLLRGGATTASVIAVQPTTVLFLARDYVERIVAGVPEIGQYLAALAEDRALDRELARDRDEDSQVVVLF